MADFYADGPKAMAGAFTPILGKAVEQMKAEVNQFKTEMTNQVEPFIQERQFNEQVAQTGEVISAFAEAHPDMEGIKPAMQEVYSADPEFYDSLPADKAIQSLYNAAKAQNAEAVENKPSLEDYLNDPGAQAKFAESDAVKQIVLSGHAEAIKNGRPPVVVGAQPGGASPAVPPEQITTTDEASKASLGLFKRLGMRG